VDAKDKGECVDYIFECILDEDPSSFAKCLQKFKRQGFFKVAKADISNLHPVLALRILQKFGFHKHQIYDDQAGAQIWKVEDVDHWIEHYLAKKFPSAEIQKMIKDNDNYYLLSYIDLISQYVNANPGILNKGYGGVSAEGV